MDLKKLTKANELRRDIDNIKAVLPYLSDPYTKIAIHPTDSRNPSINFYVSNIDLELILKTLRANLEQKEKEFDEL